MTGRLVTGLAIWSAQKHWHVCPFLLERWDRTRGNNKTQCTEISNYYKPRSDTSPKDLTLQQVFSQHFSAQQVSLSPAPPATSHTHRWGLSKKYWLVTGWDLNLDSQRTLLLNSHKAPQNGTWSRCLRCWSTHRRALTHASCSSVQERFPKLTFTQFSRGQ